jgi:CheY-like chemotaxis protein
MTTVLVIDDTDEMRDMIRMFLSRLGFEVLEATNGLDGIKMAKAHRPALILLDLMMPVAQGDFALGFLRATPEISDIPVIVTSAHPNARLIAQQLGANACLPKPFNMIELRDQMQAMLGQPN